MRTLFIRSHGKLIRDKNTLAFVFPNKEKRYIPINQIKEIFVFSNVSLTSGAIKMLLYYRIPIHFYSKTGNYLGSLYPKNMPGKVIIKQVEKYLDYGTRLYIAKSIIEACRNNFYEVFRRKSSEAKRFMEIHIYQANNIAEVMGLESQIFKLAYELFDKISKFKVVERTRHPPLNEANALISFLNSILYGLILTEIYKKGLLPTISYLHEPMENRPSLSLDIAEIFKPIFTFRLALRLFNKGMLREEHFTKSEKGVYLNENGRDIVLEVINSYLKKKIRVKGLGKRSFRFIISWQVNSLREFIEDKNSILRVANVY